MDKREKVVKGLECHFLVDVKPCEKCPYDGDTNCTDTMTKDALETLTATEHVKVKHDNGITHWYATAECDRSVNPGDEYCPGCGRGLEWGE